MARLGVFRLGDEHCYSYALSPQNLSHIPERDLNLSFLRRDTTTVVSQCGGLLCFGSGHRTVICNPTTQELKFLPPTPRLDASHSKSVRSVGFGYDSTSDDYKVIRFYILYSYRFNNGNKYYAGGTSKFELYSLRHNCWREIPVPFDEVLLFGVDRATPYVNGSVYWISEYADRFVLEFNFATENFSSFSLPPHPPDTIFSLFKIDDDSLGVVLNSKGDAKFFELWKWKQGSWSQLYDRAFLNNVERPLALIDGRLLFLERETSDDVRQLVVYDWTTNELKELDIYEYRNKMMIISYVESRVVLPNAMPFGYYDNEASWDEYWHGYQDSVNGALKV